MQGKNTLTPNTTKPDPMTPVYVGIDVCKDWLDVHVHPSGETFRTANSAAGLEAMKARLSTQRQEGPPISRLVLEATGKFHRLAHHHLHAAGLPVAVCNPARVRYFGRAMGQLAKTDKADARILALFGARLTPPVVMPPTEALETLQDLVRTRQEATASAAAHALRRKSISNGARHPVLLEEIDAMLRHYKAFVARIDREIASLVRNDPLLARRHDILRSIPGIGPVTAHTLLALMRELGSLPKKAAAALAGVAPVAHDSGDTMNDRTIRGGRHHVRTALYMAAVSAKRANPDHKAFYERLLNQKKPYKVAITAVMRKLIELANTLLAQNRTWMPKPQQNT